jgi:CheY-like chemotaxis protein
MEQPTLPILRKVILVVEDNEPFRRLCAALLKLKVTVRQASDGQSALTLAEIRPDLIISDIACQP